MNAQSRRRLPVHQRFADAGNALTSAAEAGAGERATDVSAADESECRHAWEPSRLLAGPRGDQKT
jgi:hypothetical protein